MDKWNCLIISDKIAREINNNEIKAPVEARVNITWWKESQNYNFEDYDIFFIDFQSIFSFGNDQTRTLPQLISGELRQIKFIFTSKTSTLITQAYQKKENVYDIISYLWKDMPLSLTSKGNKIIITNPKYSLSKLLFNEKNQPYHWKWAIESENLPENSQT